MDTNAWATLGLSLPNSLIRNTSLHLIHNSSYLPCIWHSAPSYHCQEAFLDCDYAPSTRLLCFHLSCRLCITFIHLSLRRQDKFLEAFVFFACSFFLYNLSLLLLMDFYPFIHLFIHSYYKIFTELSICQAAPRNLFSWGYRKSSALDEGSGSLGSPSHVFPHSRKCTHLTHRQNLETEAKRRWLRATALEPGCSNSHIPALLPAMAIPGKWPPQSVCWFSRHKMG